MRITSRLSIRITGCLVILAALSFLTPLASASSGSPSAKTSSAQSTANCAQPVPGENLLALSDAQLLALGLPNRTIISQHPNRWSYLTHDCGGGRPINLPMNTTNPKYTTANLTPSVWGDGCGTYPNTVCQNPYWAGYEATSSNGSNTFGHYTFAGMELTVPSVPSTPANYSVNFWTGLGGCYWGEGTGIPVNNNCFAVQAGIWQLTGHPNMAWVRAWSPADNPPTPEPYYSLPLCRLWAGDDVQITVDSNFQGSGYDSFDFVNWTASCYSECYVHITSHIPDSCGFTGGTSFVSDGLNGECMAEGEYGRPLANFGTAHIQRCDVEPNSAWPMYIGGQPHNSFIMYNDPTATSKYLQAKCGPITYNANTNGYDSFTIQWVSSGANY